MLDPGESVTAGFLDLLTAPEQLPEAGRQAAEQLGEIDRAAHRATKLRVRAQAIEGVREGIARIENFDGDW
jgi:enoyl-CoA hydratase